MFLKVQKIPKIWVIKSHGILKNFCVDISVCIIGALDFLAHSLVALVVHKNTVCQPRYFGGLYSLFNIMFFSSPDS